MAVMKAFLDILALQVAIGETGAIEASQTESDV